MLSGPIILSRAIFPTQTIRWPFPDFY